MLHTTKAIVLRVVKYGDTSIILTAFTELFGIQSYIVNGVRTSRKTGTGVFQPASILDLIVYHNELKNIQRIKEFKWSYLYNTLFFDVLKHSVAVFMVELLQKTLKQPEPNPELFEFAEDAFIHLDKSEAAVLANYPLYFAMHLSSFYGFRISDRYSEQQHVLDLKEGEFAAQRPGHPYFLEHELSDITSQLLKTMRPEELTLIRTNQATRRQLLEAYMNFYALHIQDFGAMKTLSVLYEVLA
jgi:DNA repair protein RecO (recombination protein O)